jgi:hypothetical protein
VYFCRPKKSGYGIQQHPLLILLSSYFPADLLSGSQQMAKSYIARSFTGFLRLWGSEIPAYIHRNDVRQLAVDETNVRLPHPETKKMAVGHLCHVESGCVRLFQVHEFLLGQS